MQILEKIQAKEGIKQSKFAKAPLLVVFLKNILWLICGLPLVLVLLELSFACGHLGEESFMQLKSVLGFGHIPEKLITWRAEGYSQSSFAPGGWRNKFDSRSSSLSSAAHTKLSSPSYLNQQSEKAILLIGDSVVESIQVPDAKSFPSLLEEKLNQNPGSAGVQSSTGEHQRFKVYNLGTSAYGTMQEYLQYKQVAKKVKAQTVVLFYHQGDNFDNTFMEGVNNFLPRPYCKLDSEQNLQIDWNFYKQYMGGEQASFYKLFDSLRRNSRIFGTYEKIDLMLASDKQYQSFKRTATKKARNVLRYFSKPDGQNSGSEKTDNATFEPQVLCSATEIAELRKVVAGTNLLNLNKPLSPYQLELKYNDDRMLLTAGVISAFAKDCREDDCKFVVVGFPAPADNLLFQRELNCIDRLSKSALGQFQYIDLNKEFSKLSKESKADAFFIYGDHLKATGHTKTAELLYQRIYAK